MIYDVFISHSSLDKDAIARPLAQALEDNGLSVWLDEDHLHVGDSIRRDIELALKESRFLVPILSPGYLQSEWCQKEIDAFFTREKQQSKSILPVYHNIDVEDVEQHWLFLADKIALNTDQGIAALAENISHSIHKTKTVGTTQILKGVAKPAWWPSANWQWLLGIAVTVAIGLIPFLISSGSTGNSITTGPIGSGSKITFDQSSKTINNHISKELDEADINALARKLINNIDLQSKEKLQEKDDEIQQLIDTISRLKKQPIDEYKQKALKKLEEGKPAEAAVLLKKSLLKQKKAFVKHLISMSKDWVDVGNIASLTDSKEAILAYGEAIQLYSDNSTAWDRLGNIQKRLGMLDKAEESYRKSLDINKRQGRKSDVACQLGNLGFVEIARGKLDEAEKLFLEALSLAKKIRNQGCLARQYSNLGTLAFSRGYRKKAEGFYLKSSKISEAHDLKDSMATTFINLGNIYYERGDLGKAKLYAQKSFEIDEKFGDQLGKSAGLALLGLIAGREGNLDKAEKLLLRALKISKAYNSFGDMSFQYSELGFAYLRGNQLKKAEEHYLKALKISEDTNSQKGIADQYHGLGLVYERSGKLLSAEKYQKDSLKIKKKLGDRHGEADQYAHLGMIFQYQRRTKSACKYLSKSLNLFLELDSHRKIDLQNKVHKYCTKLPIN